MSNSKPQSPKADAWARKLQESLAQRRPRPWKRVLGGIAFCALLIALMVWWVAPQPQPAPLHVLALDGVFTTDEATYARAQLILPVGDTDRRRLAGQTIVFTEQRLILPEGEQLREIKAPSDERGQGSADWPVPGAGKVTDFLARYVNEPLRQGGVFDRGKIYVWPKDAPLMIVDADETLIADQLDANAGKTLHKAHDAGWRIVYLALAGSRAEELRKVRGWIERQGLPNGPVLGRAHYPNDDTIDAARRGVLPLLRDRFKGPMAAVVKSAAAARVSQELGLRVIMLGTEVAPAEVLHVPTWADVPVGLK